MLKDYDMSLHYHPSKVNMVIDAFSRSSMGILAYMDEDKWEFVNDIYRLANLRVRLLDSEDGGVFVQ